MPSPISYCVSCGHRAGLVCDWPVETRDTGTCDKAVCHACRRPNTEKDYCPFHRGEPPMSASEAIEAGHREAENAARILGIVSPRGFGARGR